MCHVVSCIRRHRCFVFFESKSRCGAHAGEIAPPGCPCDKKLAGLESAPDPRTQLATGIGECRSFIEQILHQRREPYFTIAGLHFKLMLRHFVPQ